MIYCVIFFDHYNSYRFRLRFFLCSERFHKRYRVLKNSWTKLGDFPLSQRIGCFPVFAVQMTLWIDRLPWTLWAFFLCYLHCGTIALLYLRVHQLTLIINHSNICNPYVEWFINLFSCSCLFLIIFGIALNGGIKNGNVVIFLMNFLFLRKLNTNASNVVTVWYIHKLTLSKWDILNVLEIRRILQHLWEMKALTVSYACDMTSYVSSFSHM